MKEHTIELRVRYAETDQMGVVYYSNYFVWFEIARTEFFRKEGMNYREIEEKRGICLPVIESYCRYRAPLKYDEVVEIAAKTGTVTGSRITFEYDVRTGGKTCTTGYTVHTFINRSGKPIPIPEDIRKVLTS